MERNKSVDVIRVIAIFAVVVIHTRPFPHGFFNIGIDFNVGDLLNQISRFAVPFFFVISGYYWASKFTDSESSFNFSIKMAKRISKLFLAWSLIYLLPTNIAEALSHGMLGPIKVIYWNIYDAIYHPMTTLMQGTKVHLWFLISLLCSLIISSILVDRNMKRSLIALSLFLYIIGLCGKSYSNTPIGFQIDLNFRNGPFFGLIFFVSGYFLNRRDPKDCWLLIGIIFTVLGFALHFFELYMLQQYWDTATRQDYVVGTYFVGVGVSLIALSNPPILRIGHLSFIGPLVLGIYAIHFVFIDLLLPLGSSLYGNASWEIGYPIAVFVLSLVTVYGMSRLRWTRSLVI